MRILYFILIIFSGSISANTWSYAKQIDPFNDQTIHIAKVRGERDNSSIIVRCNSESKLDIILSTGRYIGNNNRYHTVLRVDKNKPTSGVWSVSTNGTSVFAPQESIAILSEAFMKGDSIVSQTTDYKGNKSIAKFSLSKSSKSIKSVLEACPLDKIGSTEKGINKGTLNHLNRYGPESIICHKKMLSHLGYNVTSRSPSKNREYYIAIQQFMDDRSYEQCNSINRTPRSRCKSYFLFMHDLYSDASKSNNDIKSTCGKLRMAD